MDVKYTDRWSEWIWTGPPWRGRSVAH